MNKEEVELYMANESLSEKAQESFFRIKLELGTRENNEHVGSGLGGNHNELFFLLTHEVNVQGVVDGEISLSQDGSNILFKIPKDATQKDLRLALTKFINGHPDKTSYTKEQLLNPSFLRDLKSTSLDVQLLIKALEIGYDLASWLDTKISLQKEINKVFEKETKALEVLFLREMNLPEDHFEILRKKERDRSSRKPGSAADPMGRMFRRHPVWGVKNTEVEKRNAEMCSHLLSDEDMRKLNMLGAFPQYITLYSLRSCISIDRMVALNLDEKVTFLDDINRRLEAGRPSDENSEDSDED